MVVANPDLTVVGMSDSGGCSCSSRSNCGSTGVSSGMSVAVMEITAAIAVKVDSQWQQL